MLTVKIIKLNGDELLYEATSVGMIAKEQSRLQNKLVFFNHPTEASIYVEEGDVYVMNDHGKTIADYHIHTPKDEVVDEAVKEN